VIKVSTGVLADLAMPAHHRRSRARSEDRTREAIASAVTSWMAERGQYVAQAPIVRVRPSPRARDCAPLPSPHGVPAGRGASAIRMTAEPAWLDYADGSRVGPVDLAVRDVQGDLPRRSGGRVAERLRHRVDLGRRGSRWGSRRSPRRSRSPMAPPTVQGARRCCCEAGQPSSPLANPSYS
jgi:hypothetical protein